MRVLAERAKRVHEIRFLRFAFVGGCGFLVNELALYLTIYITGLNKYAAWFPAFAVAVTFTWWGNRTLTFRDRAASHGLLREWLVFLIGNSLGAAANFFVYFVVLRFAPPPFANPLLALVAGTIVGLVFNFTVTSRFIFRAPKL
ncbi:MAG TPA: GtrA family protein [Rhizomicrobium sp.]|jgi:putative flippase GtrA|nr:GtrA family protein [Rhizomicrobium sp.]